MNEQPGKQDPKGDDAEDFGIVSFARVSGGTANGLPYLSSLSYQFDEGTPDPVAGKRAFSNDITRLNKALQDYDRVLATRTGDFDTAFAPGESEVLQASDNVHESLESLGLSHQAYTGHAFLEGPLYREPLAGSDEYFTQMLEASEFIEDEDREDDTRCPPVRELAATVVFDQVLHQSTTEVLRLDMANVFSNGVLLVIDYMNLREDGEDGLLWFRRSNEQNGNVELVPALQDPTNGATYDCELHWAEGNAGPGCYTLNQHFWIHRATDAEALMGTLTVNDAIAADGSTDPLVVQLEIDTVLLREAAKKIRTFGNEGPTA